MSIVIWSSAEKTNFNQTIQTVLSQLQVRYTLCQDTAKFPPVSNGDIVLSCGSKALAVLQALGVVPKNRSIASLRGKQFSHFGAKVFVTYDPMIVNRDYGRMPDIQWDTQLAVRLAVTGSLEPVYGEYRYVESLHELIEKVEEKYKKSGKPVEVACDLETKGLVPYSDNVWIITCQFTVEKGKSDVLYFEYGEKPVAPLPWKNEEEWTYWEGLWVQLDWIFKSPMVSLRGANFKFDMTWLKLNWGISVTNFKFDTMLVGSLLNENRSNSLKLHAKIMTQMGGYEDGMDKYDFGCLERVPRDELLLYAGGDTDVTYQVSQAMKEEILRDKVLSNFYVKLVHPASLAFEKLEQTGVLVDQEYYYQLQQELQVEIARIQGSMLECLPNKLRIKYKDDIAGALKEGKSPFKPKVLLDFLFTSNGLNLKPKMFTAKTKAPSTAMDHLMMFGDDEVAANFIGLFKELGSASKTLSTFVVGFLKHLRKDGRLHATYMLHRGDYGDDDSGTTCLAPTTPVSTSMGVLFAKDVEVGMKVLTHNGNWMEVEDKIDNGIKVVYRVVLDSGHHVTCTGNHPFYTEDGWVWANELEEGDKVWVYGDSEVWRVVDLDQRYEVSNWGRVRHVMSSRILSPTKKGKWGHLKVELGHRENRLSIGVHRLVAMAFVSNLYGGDQVRHLDGKGWNNVAWNLEWGTNSDNRKDAVKHGTIRRTDSDYAKLDWDMVAYIRSVEWGLGSAAKVAVELGVSRRLVSDVRNGIRWVSKPIEKFDYGFTLATVVSVEELGTMRTWGLQVKGDHSHVTAGIVTHNTGRTSAKDPAIQTLPKHSKWAKRLRKAFIAPPGKVILNCVDAMTRVLTSDLRWVKAGDVQVGDSLVGFDEELPAKWTERCLREAIVTHVATKKSPRIRITFESGRVVTVSSDHRWLGCRVVDKGNRPLEFIRSDKLEARRHKVRVVLEPWEDVVQDYDLGYLSGVLDGEGYINQTTGTTLGVAQVEGIVWDEILRLMVKFGFQGAVDTVDRTHIKESYKILLQYRISNMATVMRLLGIVRPKRLLCKAPWVGKNMPRIGFDKVMRVQVIPVGEVVSITTSTRTFVAEGLASHNCDYSQGELRICAVVANEPTMIKAYQDGMDLHALTAAQLSGYEYDEFMALPDDIREELRYGGKAGNFGLCIAEGQLVLTDSGLIPIEQIMCCHKVWDGVSFVNHDGLIYKGVKHVITYQGLTATEDHEVWDSSGKTVSLRRASSEGRTLARTEIEGKPVAVNFTENRFRHNSEGGWVQVSGWFVSALQYCKDVLLGQFAGWKDNKMSVSEKSKVPRSESRDFRDAVRCNDAEVLQGHTCFKSQVQGTWYHCGVFFKRGLRYLGLSQVPGFKFSKTRFRQDRQQRELLQDQFEAGYSVSKSQEQVKVYDLLNAGPNHRFTCSGVLVSNCYGMQHRGFKEYAFQTYGVKMTDEEAYIKREKFFELYSMLPGWHEKYKRYAHQYQMVRSPLGRIRHLPLIASKDSDMVAQAERQAVNAPIQSCLSDMMQLAMVYIQREYGDQIQMFMMTHDSLSSYVPEDEAELWGRRLKEIMENLPLARDFNWNSPLKFYVDAESGPNLAELKKLKNL